MIDRTVQEIRDTFGAFTIESWLDHEGFDSLEEACAEWGTDYVFDEIDAYVNDDASDYELPVEDDIPEIVQDDDLGYN